MILGWIFPMSRRRTETCGRTETRVFTQIQEDAPLRLVDQPCCAIEPSGDPAIRHDFRAARGKSGPGGGFAPCLPVLLMGVTSIYAALRVLPATTRSFPYPLAGPVGSGRPLVDMRRMLGLNAGKAFMKKGSPRVALKPAERIRR